MKKNKKLKLKYGTIKLPNVWKYKQVNTNCFRFYLFVQIYYYIVLSKLDAVRK